MTDFAATKAQFHLPEGMIYLDGNSLGPLPRATAARVAKPMRVGDRIARLIGAEEGHVVMGDTLSIKVYQALASCLEMNPSRKIILSDTGNFPSDLYMAEGLCRTLGQGYELKTVAPEDVLDAIDETVAVAMITEVDYRTGRRHDMAAITARAHEKGALAIWDLAHSAGAFQVELAKCNADFAVGCTYKYLNSGPGGPAFIYVAPRHADTARPALSGWQGHAAPFAFDLDYRPATGAERMRVGNWQHSRPRWTSGTRSIWPPCAKPPSPCKTSISPGSRPPAPPLPLPPRATTPCAAVKCLSATRKAMPSCRP